MFQNGPTLIGKKSAKKIFVIYLLLVSCKYDWSDRGKGLVLYVSQSPVRADGP